MTNKTDRLLRGHTYIISPLPGQTPESILADIRAALVEPLPVLNMTGELDDAAFERAGQTPGVLIITPEEITRKLVQQAGILAIHHNHIVVYVVPLAAAMATRHAIAGDWSHADKLIQAARQQDQTGTPEEKDPLSPRRAKKGSFTRSLLRRARRSAPGRRLENAARHVLNMFEEPPDDM